MAEPCQRFFVLVLSVGAGVVIRHRQPCGTATGDDGTAETVRARCPQGGGDRTYLELVRCGGRAGLGRTCGSWEP